MKITDEMVDALRRGREASRNIQGFWYPPLHVIRDIRKPPGEQEVWRGEADGTYTATLARLKDAEILATVAPLILDEAAKAERAA